MRGRDSDARLAAILMVLLGGGHANGEELAARFGVAPRTIYRDIEALKRRGVPIASTVGPGGGYILRQAADDEGRPLTSEAGLVSLLTDTGPLAGSARNEEAVADVLERAESALADAEREALDRVRHRIFFDTEEWYVRDLSEPHFERLRDAVLRDRRVDVTFRERGGGSRHEIVDPIGLVWKGGFWYLFGRTAPRRFERVRLERIDAVSETGAAFRRPRTSLVDLWRRDLAGFGVGSTTVRLSITGSAIDEFRHFNWKAENRIEKTDERWDVEMHVDNFDWLIPLALSYAGEVVIQEPLELRRRVAEAAQAIVASHEGGSGGGVHAEPESARLGARGDIRGRAIRGRQD